jgi:hypothetical protein
MNFKCFCILYFRLLGVKKRGDNKILTAKKERKISRQSKKKEEKFRSIFDAKKNSKTNKLIKKGNE